MSASDPPKRPAAALAPARPVTRRGSSMVRRRFVGAVLLLLGGAVLAATFVSWGALYDSQRARLQWPTVTGAVLASDVHGEITGGDNLDVTVRFAYDIDGRSYTGTQTWGVGEAFLGRTTSQSRAAEQKYRPGARAAVYYDPEDPAHAVVEPLGVSGGWEAIAYSLPMWAGLALAIVGIRMVVRRNPKVTSGPASTALSGTPG